MESNLFHCPIVIFKKNKLYIRDKEFGSYRNEQINIFYLWYFLIFKGSKRGINSINQDYYYDSYGKKLLNWLGNRLNNLIDNSLNVVGSAVIAYFLLKYFGI